jgi:hypothetical protein
MAPKVRSRSGILVTIELADYLEPNLAIGSNRRIVVLKHLEHKQFATSVLQSVNRNPEHLAGDPLPSIRSDDARRDIKRGGKALPLVDADQGEADHAFAVERADAILEVDAVLDGSVI